MEKNSHDIRTYDNASYIGTAELTTEEYRQYEEMSQQPQGILRLGALPHAWHYLEPEHQGTHEDTIVYIEPAY